ncbi:MAG: iron-containing alcohol dehydrogenase [bacterium]|nr:iron-containing alcohol dehydrogenase [bacterium]
MTAPNNNTNSIWQFATSGTIYFGRGCRERVQVELTRRKLRHPLIITDQTLHRLEPIREFIDELARVTSGLTVFDQGQAEPAVETANLAIDAGKRAAVDCVIGIGGGSNLDVAKLAAAVISHGGIPDDYFGFDRIPGPVLPILALPTTAGTGSEVSHSAVLTDSKNSIKVSTLSNWLRPACAIVDPELTDSCPRSVTASSGIDALVHAVEALTARDYKQMIDVDPQAQAYQGSYSLTRMLASEAIRLIARSLVVACDAPDNHAARDDMSLAATLAGLAFSNSGVGIVHALEYPIGALTHCGHGEGNGLLLPHVMRYNLSSCQETYRHVAECLGETTPDMDASQAAEAAIASITRLQRAIGIPTQLRSLGLEADSIPLVAEKAFLIRRLMDLNPRQPTLADLQDILQAAY